MPTDFSASVEIDAPAEAAWAVLVDFDGYPTWNTFCPKVITTFEVGGTAVLHVQLGRKRVVQRLVVHAVKPGEMFAWGSTIGPAFVFEAAREQAIERLGDRRCRYRTHERFEGLLAPLVGALYGRDVQRGFEDMAEAFKRRVESLAAGG